MVELGCRPFREGSHEECALNGSGAFFVAVNGHAPSSPFDLVVRYREATGFALPSAPAPGHLDVNGTVAQGQSRTFTTSVVAGRAIVVRTFSTGDVDLYIEMNQAPTTNAYLARAWTSSGNETIRFTPTANGTLHIMVDGYAAASFTLRTADD